MRIGISPFASTQEVALELATTALESGFDTVWLGDGYLTSEDFAGWSGGMETMTELSWLAGRLPQARVGVTAAVLPLRDMQWLAKQANTLHRVAGGGFVLVAAAGFWAHDMAARGIDFNSRGEVFRSQLSQLLSALVDEGLSPGPSSAGAPPVWLAGASATMRHAIELGLPFQSSRATPDELAPLAKTFFDAGGTALAHRVRVEAGDHDVSGVGVDWHAVTGGVNEVAEALGQFEELGVTDLSIVPGQSDDQSRMTLEVLAHATSQH